MHLYLHGYQCHMLKMLYSSKDIDTNSQEVDLVCLKKSRIRIHWSFTLVLFCLLHISYYGNVFKWLSGSFSIDAGSFESIASIALLTPLIIADNNGGQVFYVCILFMHVMSVLCQGWNVL